MLNLFAIVTLGVVAGLMLFTVLAFVLMLNPKVIKLYVNYMFKCVEAMQNIEFEDKNEDKEEESK